MRDKTTHSLPSLNIEETQMYYQNNLGFFTEVVNENILIVFRENISLKFHLTDDENLPQKTTCLINSEKIDLLYREYLGRKVLGLSKVSSYEMKDIRDFYIKDPHDNLLRFMTE